LDYSRSILVFFAACSLSGCVTRCWQETFFKPSLIAAEGYSITSANGYLYIKHSPLSLSVEIFECGTAYRRPDNGPVSVCINIASSSEPSPSFISQEVVVSRASGNQLQSMTLTTLTPEANKPRVSTFSGKFPETGDAEISLQLPLIQAGDKQVLLPKIMFRKVTEQRCGQSF
jgi:hypothetical protein